MKYEKVKNFVKSFSKDEIIRIEKNDPQYKALEELYNSMEDRLLFIRLAVINALLSYQLNMKGEEYWKRFSEFFSSKRGVEYFPEFLKRYNYRILSGKLKRYEKVRDVVFCLLKTEEDLLYFSQNLNEFLEKLSKLLNQKRDAKTVVFAVKMFIYAFRIAFGKDIFAPCGIMIPLDSRISKISKDKDFWKRLEKETGIPLIHVDAVLWLSDNYRLLLKE
ncbi:N-glycosylase/DNA lyase [Desulfurobacterium atlanticum]|nr:N-glycosylase/DNA lyase [Desulfurobacterium atlanticum]